MAVAVSASQLFYIKFCSARKEKRRKKERNGISEMAYRRRQGITKSSTFKEEIYHPPDNNSKNINNSNENNKASVPSFKTSHSFSPSTQSLAAQAIRASAAHRDSSLSSAYAADPPLPSDTQRSKVPFFSFSLFTYVWIGFCFLF